MTIVHDQPGTNVRAGLRRARAGYSRAMPPAVAVHDHVWHLQAVHHEEGASTEEYACEECGAVDFR